MADQMPELMVGLEFLRTLHNAGFEGPSAMLLAPHRWDVRGSGAEIVVTPYALPACALFLSKFLKEYVLSPCPPAVNGRSWTHQPDPLAVDRLP